MGMQTHLVDSSLLWLIFWTWYCDNEFSEVWVHCCKSATWNP